MNTTRGADDALLFFLGNFVYYTGYTAGILYRIKHPYIIRCHVQLGNYIIWYNIQSNSQQK